ncbi:MAG TPA: hypothetical protein VFB12_17285 [Ktedonobacteraceae bacterium]|nr:hypothetical protein [Ktedonobacteraceae bacterium]
MNTTFPFTTCCQLLGVDPKTLRHWLTEAGIEPTSGPTDTRKKLLTLEQLYQLALLYRRPITPLADPGADTQPETAALEVREPPLVSMPETQEMMQHLLYLEERLVTVCEHLTHLTVLVSQQWERQMALPPPPEGDQPSPLDASQGEAPAQARGPGWRPHPAESRTRARLLPIIEYSAQGSYVIICPTLGELHLLPDSPQWFDWLASLTAFRFVGPSGRLSAYRKSKRGHPTRSWVAYRGAHKRNYMHHLGTTESLTLTHLEQAAALIQSRVDAF